AQTGSCRRRAVVVEEVPEHVLPVVRIEDLQVGGPTPPRTFETASHGEVQSMIRRVALAVAFTEIRIERRLFIRRLQRFVLTTYRGKPPRHVLADGTRVGERRSEVPAQPDLHIAWRV